MFPSFLEAFYQNPLIQTAIFAGFLSSLASGIVGSYVVVKRIVFISGSIAHSVLGGMGFCLWLKRTQNIEWITPLHGALAAGIASALILGWIHLNYKQRQDAVIAALWSTGMAIGVLFIALTPGSNAELSDFLVGNILWIHQSDLILLASLDIFTLAAVALLYNKLLLLCFDEEQALLQGIAIKPLYYFLLTLTAISIVLLIEIVGIILVITMLTLPPTIANLYTRKLSHMMIGAVVISCFFNLTGTFLAYQLDLPPGATIALLAGLCYILALSLPVRTQA